MYSKSNYNISLKCKTSKRILYYTMARAMVFNATINTVSVLSWRSVLLVEETRVPGENDRPAACH
jgi:hypothetical protein